MNFLSHEISPMIDLTGLSLNQARSERLHGDPWDLVSTVEGTSSAIRSALDTLDLTVDAVWEVRWHLV